MLAMLAVITNMLLVDSYIMKLHEISSLWKKYESVGMIIPNIWENKKMFQTTNQIAYIIVSNKQN